MTFGNNRRNFSSEAPKPEASSSSSIFDEAEFYEKDNEMSDFQEIPETNSMPVLDGNDTLGAFASSVPKDLSNL